LIRCCREEGGQEEELVEGVLGCRNFAAFCCGAAAADATSDDDESFYGNGEFPVKTQNPRRSPSPVFSVHYSNNALLRLSMDFLSLTYASVESRLPTTLLMSGAH
jgi:hypothetical protein